MKYMNNHRYLCMDVDIDKIKDDEEKRLKAYKLKNKNINIQVAMIIDILFQEPGINNICFMNHCIRCVLTSSDEILKPPFKYETPHYSLTGTDGGIRHIDTDITPTTRSLLYNVKLVSTDKFTTIVNDSNNKYAVYGFINDPLYKPMSLFEFGIRCI